MISKTGNKIVPMFSKVHNFVFTRLREPAPVKYAVQPNFRCGVTFDKGLFPFDEVVAYGSITFQSKTV